MPVSLVILILYIAALFGISWYAKKRSEGNNENYALAGRKLSAPLICVTIIGLAVGGASTIGVSEHAFRVGRFDSSQAHQEKISSLLYCRQKRAFVFLLDVCWRK